MRKILFLLVFVFCVLKTHAQVGIGTDTPDSSTQLHIVSGDKGILIPQVPLISTTDSLTIINGNVESLLVYATIAQNDIVPGYYYWYQNKWRKLTVSDDIPENIVVWDTTNDQFNFVDDLGNIQHINIEEIIHLYETDTVITDNGNGTFTYLNEAGDSITFDTNTVTISLADGVYTFLDGEGNPITSIDTNAHELPYNNTASGLAASNVQAAIDELATQIGDLDLIDNEDGTFSLMGPDGTTILGTVSESDLTDEGDGLFTFTNNDGSDVQFDVRSVEVTFDATSNSYNFLDSSGNVIAVIDLNASNVAYDNSTSGLAGTTVQAAIDELATQIGDLDLIDNEDGTFSLMGPDGTTILGTVSKSDLTDEGDGLFTFTNNDGSDVQFDVRSVEVVFDAASNVYNFLDAAGAVIASIDMNASNVAFDNTTSGLTATDVQAALDELATQIGDLDLVDNLDGTFSLMAPDGVTVLGTVSKSDLTDEGAGLFTFTNNDGSDVQFDVRSVEVVFDAASNSYNFLDAAGAVIASIDMNASNVAFDNTTSGLAATDVQTALDELATQIGDFDLVDNLDGTFSLMAPDGVTVLGTVSKSDLTDEGAGLFTFTNNDGSDVQFDVRSVEVVFDAASNSYNFLDAAGAVIASIDMNASNVAFDNTTSGLAATDVQTALDELATQIGDLDLVDNLDGTFSLMAPDGVTVLGTVSKSDLTDEGAGLFTFTNNDGSDVQFDVRSVEVVFDAASNSYNFLDAAGAVIASIDMNASNVAFDNTTSGLTATDVQAALDELATQIGDLDLVDNLDGTFSLMAPGGVTVLGTVSKSDLTDEGAGLFTFTNNDGSDVQFDVRSVEVVFD